MGGRLQKNIIIDFILKVDVSLVRILSMIMYFMLKTINKVFGSNFSFVF